MTRGFASGRRDGYKSGIRFHCTKSISELTFDTIHMLFDHLWRVPSVACNIDSLTLPRSSVIWPCASLLHANSFLGKVVIYSTCSRRQNGTPITDSPYVECHLGGGDGPDSPYLSRLLQLVGGCGRVSKEYTSRCTRRRWSVKDGRRAYTTCSGVSP